MSGQSVSKKDSSYKDTIFELLDEEALVEVAAHQQPWAMLRLHRLGLWPSFSDENFCQNYAGKRAQYLELQTSELGMTYIQQIDKESVTKRREHVLNLALPICSMVHAHDGIARVSMVRGDGWLEYLRYHDDYTRIKRQKLDQTTVRHLDGQQTTAQASKPVIAADGTLQAPPDYHIELLTGDELYTVALSSNNRLYLQGNFFGRQCEEYQEIPLEQKVVFIGAGYNHMIYLDDEGRLWGWGRNRYGQLGLGKFGPETRTVHEPRLIESIDCRAVAVSCGKQHTLVLDERFRLWVFGSNKKGQLALPTECQTQNVPLLCPAFAGQQIREISAGDNHSAVITVDMKLWLFGSNGHGQLCQKVMVEQNSIPTKLPCFELLEAKWVICLGNNTCMIDGDGQLWIFGEFYNNDPRDVKKLIHHQREPLVVPDGYYLMPNHWFKDVTITRECTVFIADNRN